MWKDKTTYPYIFLFFCLILLLLGWNQTIELRAEEPRRAVVAMEMFFTGEYIVPHINDWPYFNKPPLFNWVLLAFFKIFQSFDEWVVRLPGILSLVLTAGTLIILSKKYWSAQAAWLAGIFLLLSADILFYGAVNAGEIDLFYMLLVSLQAVSIFYFAEKNQLAKLFIVSYILCALGFLTKGPPSLVFQFLTLGGWLLFNKKWKWIFSWQHFLGIFSLIILCGGYFWLYEKQGPSLDFLLRLLKESSQRTAAESDLPHLLVQSLVFPFRLLALLLPGSILIFLMLKKNIWKKIKAEPLLYFSVFFILINIPLYWFTGNFKARYLYPFFPFFCLIFSWAWSQQDESATSRKKQLEYLFGIFLLFLTLAIWIPNWVEETRELNGLLWKIIGCFILFVILFFTFLKCKHHRLPVFLAGIVILRLAFNLIYLPAIQELSKPLKYRDICQDILAITEDESVHFYGIPHKFESDVKIGPSILFTTNHETAALMAYQVPYYLMKENHHILAFTQVLQKDQFYLAPKRLVEDKEVEEYYEYIEGWINWRVVLFKLK